MLHQRNCHSLTFQQDNLANFNVIPIFFNCMIPRPRNSHPFNSPPTQKNTEEKAERARDDAWWGWYWYRLLKPVDINSFGASWVSRAQSRGCDINKNRNCHLLSNPMDGKWQQQVKHRPQFSEASQPCHVCAPLQHQTLYPLLGHRMQPSGWLCQKLRTGIRYPNYIFSNHLYLFL